MGGFIVSFNKNNEPINGDSFENRKQIESFSIANSKISLKKYKKLLFDIDPYYFKSDSDYIVGNGTISYKGLPYKEGFEKLVDDLLNYELDKNRLFGHFTIIHYNLLSKTIHFYFDQAGYGAPFVINNVLISSSFLACIDNLEKLHLDNNAIFEEIYTGCYFDGKTSFKEIRKITKNEVWEIEDLSIKFLQISNHISIKKYKNREEGITSVIGELNTYFDNWKPQAEELKVDLGLSSGYDSRLMLCLLDYQYKNYFQVHSYWKKERDFDNIIAEKLAINVNKNLIRIPIKNRNELTEDEFQRMINDAMIYYDGLFPVNHGWVREYRTSEHRAKILGNCKFGFSGLSGEQYRNDFNLLNRSFSFKSLINNLILEDSNDEILKSSSFARKGIDIIKNSIINGLQLKLNSKIISRNDIQRYYCEMWVSGGPGIRNRIENNLTFFLSPFTESFIQHSSYSIIPFLGYGGQFQSDLIKRINRSLASIQSDYGFSFDNVKLKHRIFWMISAFLGRKNKIKLANKLNRNSNNYIDSFGIHKNFIVEKLKYLKQFDFEFPIESNKFKGDTIDRLIALATLLKKYEMKITK